MKLGELGEFGLIERIRSRARSRPELVLGIGDDCAATTLPPGHLQLTTTDLLLQNVHFRLDWTDLHRLGRKSVSVNVSDIAAMGGEPRFLYLALGLPDHLEVAAVDELLSGVLAAADDYGACLAGGDTCRSADGLFIAVTAEGSVPAGEVIRRSGARPGDALYVSGTLGDSALALQSLQGGIEPDPALLARHHDPRARVGLGRALAAQGLASAMIDLSDGLTADLDHLLKASRVGARLEAGRLPFSDACRRQLPDRRERLRLALRGGEDYELLFTVPPDRESRLAMVEAAAGVPLSRIGLITDPQEGLTIFDGDARMEERFAGFDHFGGSR